MLLHSTDHLFGSLLIQESHAQSVQTRSRVRSETESGAESTLGPRKVFHHGISNTKRVMKCRISDIGPTRDLQRVNGAGHVATSKPHHSQKEPSRGEMLICAYCSL